MIRWFTHNHIAANFLMIAILFAGAYTAFFKIPLEVRPSYQIHKLWVEIPYRGGTPTDVEQYVVLPVERALQGLPGIKTLTTTASRGSASFQIEAEENTELEKLLEEIKTRVEGISTLPPEAENPTYTIPNSDLWFEVITVAVTGNLSESELLETTQNVRDELLSLPGISLTDILGERPIEFSIEADDRKLRDHGLSLQDLSQAIRRSSLNLSAGTMRTKNGNVMLRTEGQAFQLADFENILINAENGATLRLADVATVIEGFDKNRVLLRFNGKPALLVEAKRTGDENAIAIADAVKKYVKNAPVPDGVDLYIYEDESLRIKGRLGTLGSSLALGALLVFTILGLFLRPKVAFWVTFGIPISFAGGLVFMYFMGVSINMMSLFAFIVVLGIVVDDAIVTGENIYSRLKEGLDPEDAAVIGTKEIATPVTFGIITTIVAFIPLLFFEGYVGSWLKPIPYVVAGVLLFSLVESKLILPAHLKSLKVGRKKIGFFGRIQKSLADGLERAVEKYYRPTLSLTLKNRYLTIALFFTVALIALGVYQGGKLGFEAMPNVDDNKINAHLKMADDTPWEKTDERMLELVAKVRELKSELRDVGNDKEIITNIMSSTGGGIGWGRSDDPEEGWITFETLFETERSEPGPTDNDVAELFRQKVGKMNDVKQFRIFSQRGSRNRGESAQALHIQVRGPDSPEREIIVHQIKNLLESQRGIANAYDDHRKQADEYLIQLKPHAIELNISQRDLATQIRHAFFGDEAQRIQRGRDEIRVMIRLPEKDRESSHTFDTLSIRTPDGTNIPFNEVATATLQKAPGRIHRIDGSQVINIYGQTTGNKIDILEISKSLTPELNKITSQYSGMSWLWEGFIKEHAVQKRREAISWFALLAVLYALLAIPFRSLTQPIFVLLAIPFGLVGALIGHIIMDVTPSNLSMFGAMALAGVVVNDSLVLVDYINRRRDQGTPIGQVIINAGTRRFRPILLTSVTTFFGLVPIMFDNSAQAQFLIPMAISLGWGILFATLITLILIPCSYLIAEDITSFFSKIFHPHQPKDPETQP